MSAFTSNPAFAFQCLLVLGALICALAFAALMYAERRHFRRIGKQRSWAHLRLAFLPIGLLVAAAVIVPARITGGPEALGVFYLMLLVVAPLLWWGLHVLVARFGTPRLAAREVRFVTFSPIGLALGLVVLAHQLQGPAWYGIRTLVRLEFERAPESAAPYQLVHARRYEAPDASFTASYWRAPQPIELARVDLVRADGSTSEDLAAGGWNVCREPDGLRWLSAADAPPATLRVFWRDSEQDLHRADLATSQAFDATPFTVTWSADPNGFELPEPLPRASVMPGRAGAGGAIGYDSSALQFYNPGENPALNCVPPGWRSPNPVDAVAVLVQRETEPPLRVEVRRPPTRMARAEPAKLL